MKFTVHPPTRVPAKLAAQKAAAEQAILNAAAKALEELSESMVIDEAAAERERFLEDLRGGE